MHLTIVVLPAPLSPTSAVTSPALAVKSTEDRTCTGPNDFSTPRSSSVGVSVTSQSPAHHVVVGLEPIVRLQPHSKGLTRSAGRNTVGVAQLHQVRGRADGSGGGVTVGDRERDVGLRDGGRRRQVRRHLAAGDR